MNFYSYEADGFEADIWRAHGECILIINRVMQGGFPDVEAAVAAAAFAADLKGQSEKSVDNIRDRSNWTSGTQFNIPGMN